MTENELARALFGRKRREAEEAGSATVVVSATAIDSSSGGTVVVDFGTDVFGDTQTVDEQTGEVVYSPPSQGVEVPAAGGISAGDTVSVLVVDNQPVQAIGTGSVDRVSVVADAASTAAQEAKDVAQATGQHFWHDTRGAHVTEAEREDYETQASGFQQLMTSIGTLLTRAVNGIEYLLRSDTQSGMAIYDGTCTADDANLAQHMVASFTAQGVQLGRTTDTHALLGSNGFEVNRVLSNPSRVASAVRLASPSTSEVEETLTVADIPTTNSYQLYDAKIVNNEVVGLEVVADGSTTLQEGTHYSIDIVSEYFGLVAWISFNKSAISQYTTVTVSFVSENSDASVFELGEDATATGSDAFAHGGSEASGDRSFAHGTSEASGDYSHAEGEGYTHSFMEEPTVASGRCSHAEGRGVEAASADQHAQGRLNIIDSQGKYAHIIGNGSAVASNVNRSNAHTVDWNGNGWYQGDVSCGGTSGDAPAHTLSGAAAAAAAAQTAAGAAQTTADTVAGDAYRKSGNNVVVGGQTIGTADNLSYVSSTDSIRSPVYGYATRNTSTTNGGSVQYARCGQLVIVFFSLSVTATADNAILATGLPKPPVNSFVPAVAAVNRGAGMYVDPDGRLRLTGSTSGSAWWIAAAPYFVRD